MGEVITAKQQAFKAWKTGKGTGGGMNMWERSLLPSSKLSRHGRLVKALEHHTMQPNALPDVQCIMHHVFLFLSSLADRRSKEKSLPGGFQVACECICRCSQCCH